MNLSDRKLEEIQAKLPDASEVQNRLLIRPFAIVAQTMTLLYAYMLRVST